mgnify:CR=1 FL=1
MTSGMKRRTQRNTHLALATLVVGICTACGDDDDLMGMDSGDPSGATTSNGDDGDPSAGAGTAPSTAGDGDTSDGDALSDDFDDPGSLSAWTLREDVDGGPGNWDVLEIRDGRLRLRPTASGWYGNYVGPMLFKQIRGDFVVETSVRAAGLADPETPPSQLFNAGGLIVRDPGSRDGAQNWITHNVGRQQPEVGTEGKTTQGSESHLELRDGVHHGVLRICRVGSTFVLARRLGNEMSLHETHRFERGDLPETVQVGMMANGWNSADADPDTSVDPDVEVTFDYVRFWEPEDESDCLAQ